jgi:hypothetical protein
LHSLLLLLFEFLLLLAQRFDLTLGLLEFALLGGHLLALNQRTQLALRKLSRVDADLAEKLRRVFFHLLQGAGKLLLLRLELPSGLGSLPKPLVRRALDLLAGLVDLVQLAAPHALFADYLFGVVVCSCLLRGPRTLDDVRRLRRNRGSVGASTRTVCG